MAAKPISDEVKHEVKRIVEQFNQSVLARAGCQYLPRYRGRYLYLDREGSGRRTQICRLEYSGKIDDWEFAIFKYSSERYDSDEWFFPGSEFIDGTIEGAMKAGMEAYPSRNFGLRWYMIPLILFQLGMMIILAKWREVWGNKTN